MSIVTCTEIKTWEFFFGDGKFPVDTKLDEIDILMEVDVLMYP